jgi:hypothetical protein
MTVRRHRAGRVDQHVPPSPRSVQFVWRTGMRWIDIVPS